MSQIAWTLASTCLLQAVLFAGVLAASSSRNQLSSRLLIALLAAIALDKADQLYLIAGLYQTRPEFAMIGNVFGAAAPGLIYLHVRARAEPHVRLSWRDLYAIAPVIVLGVYVLASFHVLPWEAKRDLFATGAILTPVNTTVIPLAGDMVWLAFLAASLRLLHRHDRRMFDWFSDVENRLFVGVRAALWIICGLIAVHVLWTLTQLSGFGIALNVGHILLINALAIGAIRADAAPHGAEAAPAEAGPAPDLDSLRGVLGRVEAALAREPLHLDPDLTVAKLARAAGERPRAVSEAINRVAGGTFYDLINARRIETAKQRLLETPDRAVLEIAYECGFNSKSAFNTAFKRIAGMTPSAWRDRAGADLRPA